MLDQWFPLISAVQPAGGWPLSWVPHVLTPSGCGVLGVGRDQRIAGLECWPGTIWGLQRVAATGGGRGFSIATFVPSRMVSGAVGDQGSAAASQQPARVWWPRPATAEGRAAPPTAGHGSALSFPPPPARSPPEPPRAAAPSYIILDDIKVYYMMLYYHITYYPIIYYYTLSGGGMHSQAEAAQAAEGGSAAHPGRAGTGRHGQQGSKVSALEAIHSSNRSPIHPDSQPGTRLVGLALPAWFLVPNVGLD